jgi:hypothetical protein
MLVVRVKRYRYDEPAEELCIYEDQSNPAKKKRGINARFAALHTAETAGLTEPLAKEIVAPVPAVVRNDRKSRLILRRVSTFDQDKSGLDSATAQAVREGSPAESTVAAPSSSSSSSAVPATSSSLSSGRREGEGGGGPAKKKAKVIVAQGGSKSLPVLGRESCIVVDMMQITNPSELAEMKLHHQQLLQLQSQDSASCSSTTAATTANATSTTPSRQKILSPPTRALARGILTALKNGDFADISSALIQGADANHCIEVDKGGYSALMVAAMKCNLRMVKRLLADTADVLLRDRDGNMAIDLVKESRLNAQDSKEIRIALQTAMVKAQRELIHREQQASAVGNGNDSSGNGGSSNGDSSSSGTDFVVDIYCVQEEEENGNDAMDMSEEAAAAAEQREVSVPSSVVHIDGLRILEDGQVEMVSYDSDWSDLADDEDPDSNDEVRPVQFAP